MQRLLRIDQYAGDVAPRAQHMQRFFGHVAKRIGFMRRQRIADPRLHVAPPAVIGAAEAHQVGAACVVAGEPHRLHHRFGARHVKRDFVEAGNLSQPFHVVDDDGVIRAEYGTEVANACHAPLDGVFVEIVSEDVDAVGTGEIVEPIAVQIGYRDTIGRLQESADRQIRAHHAAVLKWHSVGAGELQIGNVFAGLCRAPARLGKARFVERTKLLESGATARHDVIRRPVRAKELTLVVFVEWNEGREAARNTRMTGDGPVFCLRQFEAAAHSDQRGGNRRHAGAAASQSDRAPSHGQCHRIGVYPEHLTLP